MAKLSLAKLERHLYSAADRLRQEGLDAATYKDYIFGMLFLKRCSDVFDAERENIVGRKVEQGMIAGGGARRSTARTPTTTTASSSPSAPAGLICRQAQRRHRAYRQRARQSPRRAERGQRIARTRPRPHQLHAHGQGNKRIVSDDACKDLVRHFSRYRLRNEDFEFPDLLGAAYEYLINSSPTRRARRAASSTPRATSSG